MIHSLGHQSVLKLRWLPVLVVLLQRLGAEYCMCLARASLAVSHDDSVETVEHILHHWPGDGLIRILLRAKFAENMIEEEVPVFIIVPHKRNTLIRLLFQSINIQNRTQS